MSAPREYQVDCVPLQVAVVTPQGNWLSRFFVMYTGFPKAEGCWEPRASLNEAVIEKDVVRMEERLQREARLEVAELSKWSILEVQKELRRAVGKGEGEGSLDRGCSALVRVLPRTAKRLFCERLDYLAKAGRTGSAQSRTWSFATTSDFYDKVFPKTQLQLLAKEDKRGRRRMLGVTARVSEAGPSNVRGQVVIVLSGGTEKACVYHFAANKISRVKVADLEIMTPCSLRFCAKSTLRNLRLRGAILVLERKQWEVAQRCLPRW